MANLLLYDDSDVAGRAFRGVAARGQHRVAVAKTAEDAWRWLRESVAFDVVFLEVRSEQGAGLAWLERLRGDPLWAPLPVVVYSAEVDTKAVRRALGLKVQNYLIKPYSAEAVYAEIGKATANPWRAGHFEEPRSFCAMMGLGPEQLAERRRETMAAYDRAAREYPGWATERRNEEVFAAIDALIERSEAAGIWGGLDYVRALKDHAAAGEWAEFQGCAAELETIGRLIFWELNPSHIPESLRTEQEAVEAREAAERHFWETIDIDASGPQVERKTLEAQVRALDGCPVVDSRAAAFQMVADGSPARLVPAMDLAQEDPGLALQVLLAANRGQHDEMTAIEDVRAAAGMLGELKLQALAKSLTTAAERQAELPPFSWAGFWTFQAAVGRMARFVCAYLDFDYMKGTAGTAGLIHDIGRLLLLKLQPHGFRAALRYARERKVPLAVAEAKHVGCSGPDLAAVWAGTRGLPRSYASVLRWVHAPETAEEDRDLVAMVAVARHICQHAHTGTSGDLFSGHAGSFTGTAAWQMLQPRLFPGFDARRLEVQAHAYGLTLRSELSGQRADHRPTHAMRAAELV